MTEQTTIVQSDQKKSEQSASEIAKPKQPRQLVRFTFYKLDPQWQLLPAEQRRQGKQELLSIFEGYEQGPLMRSYSLYGLRSDCDFMLWQVSYSIKAFQGISRKIRRSVMGPYLRQTHAFLFITKSSIYIGKNTPRAQHDPPLGITPTDKKNIFIY